MTSENTALSDAALCKNGVSQLGMSPEGLALQWRRRPINAAHGSTPFSAALWEFEPNQVHEVAGVADPTVHIVAMPMGGQARHSYFADGRLRFEMQHVACHPNIVPAGETPRALLSGLTTFTVLHCYLPVERVRALAEEALGNGVGDGVLLINPCGAIADREIARPGGIVLAELRSAAPCMRLRIDMLCDEIALHMLRHHSTLATWLGHDPRCRTGGLAAWQAKRACEAMAARLDGNIGLDDLAALVGLSPTHFSRAFKQAMGVAPFHWLAEQRIERAKGLLADRRIPLAEVALAVGFSAQPHFTTAFRRATGTTPGAWRRARPS
jgi:AraC family transcriptional regulator